MSRKYSGLAIAVAASLCVTGCGGGASVYAGPAAAYANPLGNAEALPQENGELTPAKVEAVVAEGGPNTLLVKVASSSQTLQAEQISLDGSDTPVQLQIEATGASGVHHDFRVEAMSPNPFLGAFSCKAAVRFYDPQGYVPATFTELEFEVKPRPLPAETLCATPFKHYVHVGEEVPILVCTGTIQQPFEYLTSVRLVTSGAGGFSYVPHSFNVGAPGGAVDAADGLWKGMELEGFVLPLEEMYRTQPALDGEAIDFGIAPIAGHELTAAEGELFNFRATFSQPGSYTLRFEGKNVVDRTYFQDSATTLNSFWTDISNAHTGYGNTVVVTE